MIFNTSGGGKSSGKYVWKKFEANPNYQQNLLNYWAGNEIPSDATNTGTTINDGSFYFDKSSWLTVPCSLSKSSNFTFELFVHYISYGNNDGTWWCTPFTISTANTSDRGFYIHNQSSATKLCYNSNEYSVNYLPSTGKFLHVAYVKSGKTLYLFFDGKIVATGNPGNVFNYNISSISLGALVTNGTAGDNARFYGYIKDVGFHNVALWTSDFDISSNPKMTGSFVDYVVGDDVTEYPDKGIHTDGFYYELY